MVTKMQNPVQDASLEESKESKLPKEVYVIAQEVKMVKALASNDPKQRERQLKKLKKWFSLRSASSFSFSDADLMRIWKGLFYCMWMADKPLYQENLADDLGKLVGSFSDISTSIQFFGAFLQTMVLEWFGIDQWRIDKFLMLIRKMFRHMFYEMKKNNWSEECIKLFNSQLNSTIFSEHEAQGLILHISDIFLEELAKVAGSNIPGHSVAEIIKPFITYIAKQNDFKQMEYVQNRVIFHWLWQSQRGREHTEKFKAWQEMGFPTESIYDLEKIEDNADCLDKEEVTEATEGSELDPRAGNIDVYIPELAVNVSPIIQLIEDMMFKDVTNTKSRRMFRTILQKYKSFESGGFPLGVKRIPKPKLEPLKPLIDQKVKDLENLEDELYSTSRIFKKLNKKKRRKLLASIDFEQIDEENFDEAVKNALSSPKVCKSKDAWTEEQIETPLKKSKPEKRKSDHLESKAQSKKVKSKKADPQESNQWEESSPDLKSQEPIRVSSDEKAENMPSLSWDEPLKDGEIEYFVPSRKQKLKEIAEASQNDVQNEVLLSTPLSKIKGKLNKKVLLGKSKKMSDKKQLNGTGTSPYTSKEKRVKIVLHKNMSQKPSDYIQQVRSSPQLPYDSQKKPSKGLLKPNLLPSPINPFYKKKIGLNLSNI